MLEKSLPAALPALRDRSASITVQLDTGMAMTLGCIRPPRPPAEETEAAW